MSTLFTGLCKKDVQKYIKEMNNTDSLINSQLTDALDMYSQCKTDKTTALAKNFLVDTDSEIINSEGFLVFYQLCAGPDPKLNDRKFQDLISQEATKNKGNKKNWSSILENIPSPSLKKLLLEQAYLEKIEESKATIKVSSKWFSVIQSKKDLINQHINEFFIDFFELEIKAFEDNNDNEKDKSLNSLNDTFEVLSLLKPWKGIFKERTEYLYPRLAWRDGTKQFPNLTTANLFLEEFYFQEEIAEFLPPNRRLLGIYNNDQIKFKFLNFTQRKVLQNILNNPKNNLALKAFIQYQISKALGFETKIESKRKDSKIKDPEELLLKALSDQFKKELKFFEEDLPSGLKYDDPLWKGLLEAAEKLRESVIDFRIKAESKIANYIGDERNLLFEKIFQFLNKFNLNPIAIPTIEKLGDYEGGYYLVKNISKVFQGLKNIREPYSKWVIKRLEEEQEDINVDEVNMDNENLFREAIIEKWMNMYEDLKVFDKKYNDKNKSPISLRSYSPRLFKWVAIQRMKYKNGKLAPKQVEALEKLKFLNLN